MKHDDAATLLDIEHAARLAMSFVAGTDQAAFEADVHHLVQQRLDPGVDVLVRVAFGEAVEVRIAPPPPAHEEGLDAHLLQQT